MKIMDSGLVIYTFSRLLLGALAAFLAIMLWSKTRDAAWMLVVLGTIAAYAEIIYSILQLFGLTSGNFLPVGEMPLMSIVLPCLPVVFFITALLVMVVRKYRRY